MCSAHLRRLQYPHSRPLFCITHYYPFSAFIRSARSLPTRSERSVLPCSSPEHAGALRDYITRYANHPNQLKHNDTVFASTFAGETCTFGCSSSVDGWKTQFVDQLTGDNKVHFVSAFLSDPRDFKDFDNIIDGAYGWISAWPVELTAETAASLLDPLGGSLTQSLNSSIFSDFAGFFDSDDVYLSGLSGMSGDNKTYIAAVSPWFHTRIPPLNKSWVHMTGDHLYNKRWETIITNRDKISMVEIGPIEGDQPGSQNWVNGYYTKAFKTGSFPEITLDKLYMWSRPHSRDATVSSDPLGKLLNYRLMEDAIHAVVMATSPSTLTLSNGPSSQTFGVPTDVNKLSIPILAGGKKCGKVERNGNTTIELDPEFTFDSNPKTYNYNAFVVCASGDENQSVNPPLTGTSVDNPPSPTVGSFSRTPDTPVPTPSPLPPSPSSSSPSPPSSSSTSPSSSLSSFLSPSEGPESNPVPNPSSPAQFNLGSGSDSCKFSRRHYRRSSH